MNNSFDPEKQAKEFKKQQKEAFKLFGGLYILFFLIALFLFKTCFPTPKTEKQDYIYNTEVNTEKAVPVKKKINQTRKLLPEKVVLKKFGDTLYAKVVLEKNQTSEVINIPANYRIMIIPDKDYFVYDVEHKQMYFHNHHLAYSLGYLDAFYLQATKQSGVTFDVWLLPMYNDK